MFVGNSGSNFAQSFVQLTTQAARPQFELNFNVAQNAAVDRLNQKIVEINESEFGRSKTAVLQIKANRLGRERDEVGQYRDVTQTNWFSIKDAQAQLTELRALADPSTISQFETKLAQLQDTYASFRTTQRFRFAAPDGLRNAQTNGQSALSGITHNNFASQADIDSVQATIDSLSSELNTAFSIVDNNFSHAKALFSSVDLNLDKVNLKIEELEVVERERKVEEIKELEEEISRVLTNISLSFELSQEFANFVNSSVLPQEVEPGSVLNLFT